MKRMILLQFFIFLTVGSSLYSQENPYETEDLEERKEVVMRLVREELDAGTPLGDLHGKLKDLVATTKEGKQLREARQIRDDVWGDLNGYGCWNSGTDFCREKVKKYENVQQEFLRLYIIELDTPEYQDLTNFSELRSLLEKKQKLEIEIYNKMKKFQKN